MDLLDQGPRPVEVGDRLRELRERHKMSMRSLARASGLSTNALSMIERGRSSPSVSTLYKISEALMVPITAFFRPEPDKKEIVFCKAQERSIVPFPRGNWEGLGGEYFVGGVEPFMLTLEPGANSGRFHMLHSGNEFVLCLSGEIEYEVEEQRFQLEAGDSLIFAAQLRHRWRNAGRNTARAVISLSCFERGESPSEFHLTSTSDKEDGSDQPGEE